MPVRAAIPRVSFRTESGDLRFHVPSVFRLQVAEFPRRESSGRPKINERHQQKLHEEEKNEPPNQKEEEVGFLTVIEIDQRTEHHAEADQPENQRTSVPPSVLAFEEADVRLACRCAPSFLLPALFPPEKASDQENHAAKGDTDKGPGKLLRHESDSSMIRTPGAALR